MNDIDLQVIVDRIKNINPEFDISPNEHKLETIILVCMRNDYLRDIFYGIAHKEFYGDDID